MNEAIKMMLSRYKLTDIRAQENALKEIIQEIALLALWRSKFFEKAAFYGGTALRIFYGLDRFSEDLDFSLLKPSKHFDLISYHKAIKVELESYGFSVQINKKKKNIESAIQSAFIKANTQEFLFEVETPKKILKIKFEVDTDPPDNFNTEAKYVLHPIEFFVKLYAIADMFAGKLHAILFRQWKNRVKGRDWYDLIWFVKNNHPVHLKHLVKRIQQTNDNLTLKQFDRKKIISMLLEKIDIVDFANAKKDIEPFIADKLRLDIWSKDFFKEIVHKICFI